MPLSIPPSVKISKQFLILAFFLVVVFLTGGSSRDDEMQVALLYPVSIAFCGIAMATVRLKHILANRLLLTFTAIILALPLLHFVYPAFAFRSPKLGMFDSDLFSYFDITPSLWPLSPAGAERGLQALTIPLTVILLTIQLDKDDRYRLLPLLIVLASISGLLGIFQVIGDPSGVFYFYSVTNNGAAVGLFANRNHSATLLACLIPMLAVYASSQSSHKINRLNRKMASAIVGFILIPILLVTGSRSGLLMSVIGLGGAALLYRGTKTKNARHRIAMIVDERLAQILIGLTALCGGLVTILFSRAEAIERLLGKTYGESRTEFNLVSIDLFQTYYPLGAGSGSFVKAYQIAEPMHLLDFSYLNQAHNDWLEVAVTFGMPGIAIMTAAVFGYTWRSYHLWRHGDATRRTPMFGRMASIAMALIALSSISDYPLRTPIILALTAILLCWFLDGREEQIESKAGH